MAQENKQVIKIGFLTSFRRRGSNGILWSAIKVHERYKDLALIEWAFRQSKTVHLEMRPIHVRLESRTRGHAFVVMLAYSIIQALANYWRHLDLTVKEGLDQLATLCLNEIHLPDQSISYQLPIPRDTIQKLLDAAHVKLPIKIVPKKPGRNH